MRSPTQAFSRVLKSGLLPSTNQLKGFSVFVESPILKQQDPGFSQFLRFCGCIVMNDPDKAELTFTDENFSTVFEMLGGDLGSADFANLSLNENGLPIKLELLTHGGKLHCDSGPALICWHPNGRPREFHYRQHGVLHRECGPSYQRWLQCGALETAFFQVNGKLHNENGPAFVLYDRGECVIKEEFFLDGVELSKDRFTQVRTDAIAFENLKPVDTAICV